MSRARECGNCIYGDNGPNPSGCSSECFELDLPDFDPIPEPLLSPAHAFRVSKVTTITTLIRLSPNHNDEKNGER